MTSPLIPYGRQEISEDDIAAVVDVLRSDWLTQGPKVDAFERAVADRCGAPYAVAVNSGTSALHIGCQALDIGPGDLVWTVPNTFVASGNCARYCGADIDFVDIDPETYNLSVADLRDKLVAARSQRRLPKLLIPVHFAGMPCDMEEISGLALEFGFAIMEDASHALGASYRGEPVGTCKWSDLTVFSFHPVKIITTGEGGMVLTRREDLAERLRVLRSHGITRDPARMKTESHGPWYYEQLELGHNYRITDIQCALGLSQLTKLVDFVARRCELAQRYHRLLEGLPVKRPLWAADRESAWHLYVVQLDATLARLNRRAVFEHLRRNGIGVNVHYIPVHLQPYYRSLGFIPGQFPYAERYYEAALSLPLFPHMTDSEQDLVVNVLAGHVSL